MIIIDELHAVTAVLGEQEHRLTLANLCGDIDTLPDVRARVIANLRRVAPSVDEEQAGAAFDDAFMRCEAIPGNRASASAAIDGGDLVVTRSLEGVS